MGNSGSDQKQSAGEMTPPKNLAVKPPENWNNASEKQDFVVISPQSDLSNPSQFRHRAKGNKLSAHTLRGMKGGKKGVRQTQRREGALPPPTAFYFERDDRDDESVDDDPPVKANKGRPGKARRAKEIFSGCWSRHKGTLQNCFDEKLPEHQRLPSVAPSRDVLTHQGRESLQLMPDKFNNTAPQFDTKDAGGQGQNVRALKPNPVAKVKTGTKNGDDDKENNGQRRSVDFQDLCQEDNSTQNSPLPSNLEDYVAQLRMKAFPQDALQLRTSFPEYKKELDSQGNRESDGSAKTFPAMRQLREGQAPATKESMTVESQKKNDAEARNENTRPPKLDSESPHAQALVEIGSQRQNHAIKEAVQSTSVAEVAPGSSISTMLMQTYPIARSFGGSSSQSSRSSLKMTSVHGGVNPIHATSPMSEADVAQTPLSVSSKGMVSSEAISNAAFLFSPSYAEGDESLLRLPAPHKGHTPFAISTADSRSRLTVPSTTSRSSLVPYGADYLPQDSDRRVRFSGSNPEITIVRENQPETRIENIDLHLIQSKFSDLTESTGAGRDSLLTTSTPQVSVTPIPEEENEDPIPIQALDGSIDTDSELDYPSNWFSMDNGVTPLRSGKGPANNVSINTTHSPFVRFKEAHKKFSLPPLSPEKKDEPTQQQIVSGRVGGGLVHSRIAAMEAGTATHAESGEGQDKPSKTIDPSMDTKQSFQSQELQDLPLSEDVSSPNDIASKASSQASPSHDSHSIGKEDDQPVTPWKVKLKPSRSRDSQLSEKSNEHPMVPWNVALKPSASHDSQHSEKRHENSVAPWKITLKPTTHTLESQPSQPEKPVVTPNERFVKGLSTNHSSVGELPVPSKAADSDRSKFVEHEEINVLPRPSLSPVKYEASDDEGAKALPQPRVVSAKDQYLMALKKEVPGPSIASVKGRYTTCENEGVKELARSSMTSLKGRYTNGGVKEIVRASVTSVCYDADASKASDVVDADDTHTVSTEDAGSQEAPDSPRSDSCKTMESSSTRAEHLYETSDFETDDDFAALLRHPPSTDEEDSYGDDETVSTVHRVSGFGGYVGSMPKMPRYSTGGSTVSSASVSTAPTIPQYRESSSSDRTSTDLSVILQEGGKTSMPFRETASVNPTEQLHRAAPGSLCLSPMLRTPMQARKWRALAAAAQEKSASKDNASITKGSSRQRTSLSERHPNIIDIV